jgi:hypothetical protein
LSSPGVLALKTWLRRSRTIHTRRCVPIYPHRLLGIAMSLFWEHSTEGLLRADRGKVKGRPRTPAALELGFVEARRWSVGPGLAWARNGKLTQQSESSEKCHQCPRHWQDISGTLRRPRGRAKAGRGHWQDISGTL